MSLKYKDSYIVENMKMRSYKKWIPIIVIALVAVGLDLIARHTQDSFREMAQEATRAEEEETAPWRPEGLNTGLEAWLSLYEASGIDLNFVDADALFNDPAPYMGKYVVTVFPIKAGDTFMVEATTKSNHSIYFSIVCNFDDQTELKPYSIGDVVAVAGKVTGVDFTVVLSECHVIASGEEALALENRT